MKKYLVLPALLLASFILVGCVKSSTEDEGISVKRTDNFFSIRVTVYYDNLTHKQVVAITREFRAKLLEEDENEKE